MIKKFKEIGKNSKFFAEIGKKEIARKQIIDASVLIKFLREEYERLQFF